jgi:hypothetical protein
MEKSSHEEMRGPDHTESTDAEPERWEKMDAILYAHGFIDITDHPLILDEAFEKNLHNQDYMYGSRRNESGVYITTVWLDGHCWAYEGNHPELKEIEEELGHHLSPGALQPDGLDLDYEPIEIARE